MSESQAHAPAHPHPPHPPWLEGLDHIALVVRDIERSIDWYTRTLGLMNPFPGQWGGRPTFLVAPAGRTGVALFAAGEPGADDPAPARRGPRVDHLAFRLTRGQFEQAKQWLAHLGIEPRFEDHQIAHSLYFPDPDGHLVEITTYQTAPFAEQEGPRGLRIREATDADRPAWLRMRAQLFADADPDVLDCETADIIQRGQIHGMPMAALIAATPDGEAAGFAEVSLRSHAENCVTSPVGFLEAWHVEPAWRGQGLGRALVAAAEQWARDRGCREMGSDALIDNEPSLRAHLKLGYEEACAQRCFRKWL